MVVVFFQMTSEQSQFEMLAVGLLAILQVRTGSSEPEPVEQRAHRRSRETKDGQWRSNYYHISLVVFIAYRLRVRISGQFEQVIFGSIVHLLADRRRPTAP